MRFFIYNYSLSWHFYLKNFTVELGNRAWKFLLSRQWQLRGYEPTIFHHSFRNVSLFNFLIKEPSPDCFRLFCVTSWLVCLCMPWCFFLLLQSLFFCKTIIQSFCSCILLFTTHCKNMHSLPLITKHRYQYCI